MENLSLELSFTEDQEFFFFKLLSKYKLAPKGRRTGFTHSSANYLLDRMSSGEKLNILWVDTIQGNIDRYVERYFLPPLKAQIPRTYWKWRQQKKELTFGNSFIDFRSADRAENIEGFGYHIIVLNEAGIILKGERGRYLWENAILPMVADFDAEVIIGGTPKEKTDKKSSKDCLYYRLFQRAKSSLSKNSSWKGFVFKTRDNPFLSQNAIDELERELPPVIRKQELEGLFVDLSDFEVFLRDWWIFDEVKPEKWLYRVQSWDTAFKDGEENDFSVCTTWLISANGFHLIDFWKGQVLFPELKRRAVELYELHEPDLVLIEDKASGQSLIDELREGTRIPLEPIKVDRDKLTRAVATTPLFEEGKVHILNGQEWTSEVINALSSFPEGGRDETDSVSQLLNYYRGKNEGVPIIRRKSGKSARMTKELLRGFKQNG